MRTYFYLLTFIVFLQSCAQTTSKANVPAIDEIKNILAAQQLAWNRGDIDAFMEGYWQSDSLSFIGSKGITYGWQNTLDNYKIKYPDTQAMGQLQFDILKTDILSPTCVVMIGRYTLIRAHDQPTGLFTLIWKNIKSKWVITSDQTC